MSEKTDTVGINESIVSLRAPNDIVREHALDVHPLHLQKPREERRSEWALLFAPDGREDDGSSTTATPDVLSPAPGASSVKFMISVTRES